MLLELSIRNFAIIEDLTIALEPGLTILSGETGAGKSIIINAVNLLLGGRATAALIRTGAETAELEALFDAPADSPLAAAMTEAGHDPTEGLMVRRIISRNDRHKCYINGRLATMQVLTNLTARLASISGQHAHQGLLKEESHLAIIDLNGGLTPLLDAYEAAYQGLVPLIREERKLLDQQARQEEERALLEFQNREIQKSDLSPNEDEILENDRRRMKNSTVLLETAQGCIEQLYNKNDAIVNALVQMGKDLAKAARIDDQLAPMAAELESLAYSAEDTASKLNNYINGIDLDPGQLEQAEARLDLLNKLKRKYGGSLDAVFEYQAQIQTKLDTLEHIEDHISNISKEIAGQHDKLCRLAEELSKKRRRSAEQLAAEVEKQLADVKMAGTRFSAVIEPLEATAETSRHLVCDKRLLSPTGWDRAAFMIAPNVGETAKPLAAIASGGELSRVVLALKAIQAGSDALETIVFDEVDAGIGGSVADLVGKKMAHLAGHHQVLCITHLPQIARYGNHHFRIEKQIDKGRTRTTITPLNPEERIMEIARMLSGETITATTLAHAKEMLSSAI